MEMIELIARRFRALGEPYRLRILQKLQMGEKTVGELVTELDGNQSNVSKHLKIMYETGLVSRRRLGMSVSYAISDPTIFQLCSLVSRSEAQRREQELEELSGNVSAKRNTRKPFAPSSRNPFFLPTVVLLTLDEL